MVFLLIQPSLTGRGCNGVVVRCRNLSVRTHEGLELCCSQVPKSISVTLKYSLSEMELLRCRGQLLTLSCSTFSPLSLWERVRVRGVTLHIVMYFFV
ncbi:hypothetical protein HAP32_00680 [Serratia fonticola]|nr:hypothetical protein HAP32_00680 [Serratia fonticola]